MKIGFIGFGNMADAIAGGMMKSGLLSAKDVCASDCGADAGARAKALGFTVLKNNIEVVKQSDFVFLCVKPQSFTQVLSEIVPFVHAKNKFLTIAAGVNIASITNILGDVAVVRAMPNTPLLLSCGTVALTCNDKTSAEDFAFIKLVFSSVGSVYEIPEDKFNEIINVNGSTPAYIYLFAKIIAEFAQGSGIPYDTALVMFCDTLKGSAEMMLQSGKTVDELITMVSSKGGTTVAALNKFHESGFEESLKAGMQACVDRAYEMSL